MSLGGGYTQAINDAVEAAIDEVSDYICTQAHSHTHIHFLSFHQGVNFALAAGNEYTDACSRSPAATEKALVLCMSCGHSF